MDKFGYEERFSRAHKVETLHLMVAKAARDGKFLCDRSVESYRQAALTYKRLGSERGEALFTAAFAREQQLETRTTTPPCALTLKLQKALQLAG